LLGSLLGLIAVLMRRISRELMKLQLRSDFLSGVSHDLKTPLASILLHSELLVSCENLSDEERRNCCQVIARAASGCTT